jgi:hypothetical protein
MGAKEMIITCKKCGKNLYLLADNIGLKINYYGDCDCGMHYDADYDAKTKSKLREKWFDSKSEYSN